jgi:photosystem II stability/assembly factor-like uncharacterized protein
MRFFGFWRPCGAAKAADREHRLKPWSIRSDIRSMPLAGGPRNTPGRARVLFACVLACALGAATSHGATSTTVVAASVPSATTLDVSACPATTAGITDFGSVTPGSVVKTSADCTVTFGSSNDTSSLRVGQSDGAGTAMGTATNAWTRSSGSSQRWSDIDEAAGTAWALRTNGLAQRSVNDGVSWVTTAGLDPLHDDIDVATASVAWTSGGGSTGVRRSTNANGVTPTFPATTASPGINVRGIAATGALTAWVVGDGGAIRRTIDGGTSWTVETSPTALPLEGIFALDGNSLVAWGDSGLVIATSDGTTWRDISMPGGPDITKMTATSDDNLVGTAGATIIHTTNATNATPTWATRTTSQLSSLTGVLFTTANDGLAVGETGAAVTTANAGVGWTPGKLDTSVSMSAIVRTSAGTLLVAGASLQIWRSTSIAGPWTSTAAAPVTSWNDVSMTTDGTGWRVGSGGAIDRTTDFGATWVAQTSTTSNELMGVYAFDPQHAIAVGWKGAIVFTSNGGTTWSTRTVTAVDLERVHGTSDGSAWTIGFNGTILRTRDFGATWLQQRQTIGEKLYAVVAFDRDTVVATSATPTWTVTSN